MNQEPYTESPVYVAGAGIICAIGSNVGECIQSFDTYTPGINPMKYLDSLHTELPVAEVKHSNDELALMAAMRADASRTALLSCIAAKEALASAGIENIASLRAGFISANTVGGMDKSEQFFKQFTANRNAGRLRYVNKHECGSVTEMVAAHLNLQDQVTTISTACSSSANAIFYAARLIRHGLLDVAVAGGTDALTKFTLNGFNTLMILDKEYCRPFDDSRAGLNLGEGAGYVVLVSEKIAATLPNIYCRFSGYCNANDAYHQTASSPDGDGSYLAMAGALKKSGLQPADINYINLHGTGTQNNDNAEGTAITRLFAPYLPAISSTKSFTGHTLGASGGIEAVFSALAIKHGYIYPNLRFATPMKELSLIPEMRFLKNEPLRHVLSNSFGFGGNCTSLIFSKA
jgi:3-oxoacyl-(acyl-carrier-protein) synthase